MKNTGVNKKKVLVVVFLILTLAGGFATISALLSGTVVTGLSILGFKSMKKMSNQPTTQTTTVVQPSGDKVAFERERLDLGWRNDGCYYTIIRMVDAGYYPAGGEYVVLKKSGSVPSVDYSQYFAETGQTNPYLIKSNLGTDDFSDLIDGKMVVNNPQIFSGRTDMIFKVIDMDSDILKTAADYQSEKNARLGNLIVNAFGAVVVGFASVLGVILAIIQFITAFGGFIVFVVFLILFLVFLSKDLKEKELRKYD